MATAFWLGEIVHRGSHSHDAKSLKSQLGYSSGPGALWTLIHSSFTRTGPDRTVSGEMIHWSGMSNVTGTLADTLGISELLVADITSSDTVC